jgi:signal peptidase II
MNRALLFYLPLVLALWGCDHASKVVARRYLSDRPPVILIRGVVDLTYAENHDSAFSLTRAIHSPHKPLLLGLLAAVALGAVGWSAWRRRADLTVSAKVALAVIFAGALGNVVDRLGRGAVIDFIHVHHYPVFNVADILVVAGGALLALQKPRPPAAARSAA